MPSCFSGEKAEGPGLWGCGGGGTKPGDHAIGRKETLIGKVINFQGGPFGGGGAECWPQWVISLSTGYGRFPNVARGGSGNPRVFDSAFSALWLLCYCGPNSQGQASQTC